MRRWRWQDPQQVKQPCIVRSMKSHVHSVCFRLTQIHPLIIRKCYDLFCLHTMLSPHHTNIPYNLDWINCGVLLNAYSTPNFLLNTFFASAILGVFAAVAGLYVQFVPLIAC